MRLRSRDVPAAAPRLSKIRKNKPVVGASCRHKCNNKAICRHKCCNVALRLADWPKAEEFINSNDLTVHLLDFLPAHDLLQLRLVNFFFSSAIQRSKSCPKTLFLEAETLKHPLFEASMRDELISSHHIARRVPRFNGGILFNAPARRVRINPFVLSILGDARQMSFSTDAWYPYHFTSDGVSLFANLRLEFSATDNSSLSRQSSCMDMFLTQPPVKEVVVCARQRFHYRHGHTGTKDHSSGRDRLVTGADGGGARYRDLYRHLNRHAGLPGLERIDTWGTVEVLIARCEALDENGKHVTVGERWA
jgi:hypothetical protein